MSVAGRLEAQDWAASLPATPSGPRLMFMGGHRPLRVIDNEIAHSGVAITAVEAAHFGPT